MNQYQSIHQYSKLDTRRYQADLRLDIILFWLPLKREALRKNYRNDRDLENRRKTIIVKILRDIKKNGQKLYNMLHLMFIS